VSLLQPTHRFCGGGENHKVVPIKQPAQIALDDKDFGKSYLLNPCWPHRDPVKYHQ